MNIQFVKLQLHNFASYKDSTLDLNDMGFTLVEGRNRCKLDNAYSNGSGKSAIFNGLCYALAGETVQGISTGIENIFTDPEDCWVRVTFYVDNVEFVVERIKTPKQNMKIFINGEDCSGKGIRESSQVLASYLPDLTPELLSSIIILGQGLPHRFTNNKPSHRKELLETLTKSDFMIQAIKDKLELRMTDLRSELRSKEDLSITNSSQLKVYESQLKTFQDELDDYNKIQSDGISLEGKVSELADRREQITADKEANLEKLAEAKKYFDSLLPKVGELNSEMEAKLSKDLEPLRDQLSSLESDNAQLLADYKSLQRELKSLQSITDTCPTCGQKIPDFVKPDTKGKEEEINAVKTQLDNLSDSIKQLKEDISFNEQEIRSVYGLKQLDLKNDTNKARMNISLYESYNVEFRNELDAVNDEYNKYNSLKNNYDKLRSSISDTQKQIETINGLEVQNNSEKVVVNSHIEVVQQMITLAKREFRGILLSNVIKFIDKKVKQYSKEVFGTDKLAFTLDDNYIDITYCDKLYENLSGGEKQKIDIIIQLALRDILSKQLNIHSNLLVLDEIYDNADAISCQKITNLISTLTDIDSIFIISHHVQDLGITYDNKVLVEKDENGISSLSFA